MAFLKTICWSFRIKTLRFRLRDRPDWCLYPAIRVHRHYVAANFLRFEFTLSWGWTVRSPYNLHVSEKPLKQ